METILVLWHKISPRVKWILVGLLVAAILLLWILAKLHGAQEQAQALALALSELKAKQAVSVIQGDIKAEQAKADANQQVMDDLAKKSADQKAVLEKTYVDHGMSADEISRRLNALGT